MELNHSDLKNFLVFVKGLKQPITTIEDLLINPESGKIAAFFTNHREQIILPHDVLRISNNKLEIESLEALIEAEDIIVVQKLLKKEIWILKNKVYTKKGDYLGKVYDYVFDSKLLSLKKILVGKSILGLIYFQTRIIDSEEIVEIKKDKIIVKKNLEIEKTSKLELRGQFN